MSIRLNVWLNNNYFDWWLLLFKKQQSSSAESLIQELQLNLSPVSSAGSGTEPSTAGGGRPGWGSSSAWGWWRGGFIRVQVSEVCSHLLPGHHHIYICQTASQTATALSRRWGWPAGRLPLTSDHTKVWTLYTAKQRCGALQFAVL